MVKNGEEYWFLDRQASVFFLFRGIVVLWFVHKECTVKGEFPPTGSAQLVAPVSSDVFVIKMCFFFNVNGQFEPQ